MKKAMLSVVIAALIVFALPAAEAIANDIHFFIGGNFGLDAGIGGDDKTAIEESSLGTGLTLRWIGDTMGLGYTIIKSTHKDNDQVPGIAESKLSYNTLDFLFRFGKEDPALVKYFILAVGSAEEKFTNKISGYPPVNRTYSVDVWGIGAGAFGKASKESNFTIGGEIRYISYSGSENMNGNLQMMITLGFVM